jgi:polar amino acid transport system substrate-binding protein
MLKIIMSFLLCIASSAAFADDKMVRIAITNFPPFEWQENGKTVGADADTALQVFTRAGYKVEFVLVPWKRAVSSTENGEFDALMSIKATPEREQKFMFSDALAYTQNFIFKRKDFEVNATKISELKPYKIGTIDGYAYGAEFDNAGLNLEPMISADPELSNLRKLKKGNIDLIVCEVNVCSHLINTHQQELKDLEHIKSLPIDMVQEYKIAFSRKNAKRSEQILKDFNAELKKYVDEGLRNKSFEKYKLQNLSK